MPSSYNIQSFLFHCKVAKNLWRFEFFCITPKVHPNSVNTFSFIPSKGSKNYPQIFLSCNTIHSIVLPYHHLYLVILGLDTTSRCQLPVVTFLLSHHSKIISCMTTVLLTCDDLRPLIPFLLYSNFFILCFIKHNNCYSSSPKTMAIINKSCSRRVIMLLLLATPLVFAANLRGLESVTDKVS